MKNYKYVYMTEEMVAEVDELLNGEHGNAITAFGLECGNAAIEGFMGGLKSGRTKGSLLAAAGCGVILIGGIYLGTKIARKMRDRKQEYIQVLETEVEAN